MNRLFFFCIFLRYILYKKCTYMYHVYSKYHKIYLFLSFFGFLVFLQEERITPKEELELGTLTQEAIRLQKLHDDLIIEYGREPSDDEWCAAAGKINMETLQNAIEDGIHAKNQLVTANLRMVQGVVNLYIRNGLGSQYNAGDLMQEGTVVSRK
jgi:DNA-directed RNA polymerase specialized sigma subunit